MFQIVFASGTRAPLCMVLFASVLSGQTNSSTIVDPLHEYLWSGSTAETYKSIASELGEFAVTAVGSPLQNPVVAHNLLSDFALSVNLTDFHSQYPNEGILVGIPYQDPDDPLVRGTR